MRPVYLISLTPHEGVIHLPLLTVRFLNPKIDFSLYTGIVLTSKQGVEALGRYEGAWRGQRCLCVGEATAKRARSLGIDNIEIAGGYGDSISALLTDRNHKGRWLYLRPKVIATEWVEEVRQQGCDIEEAVVYESGCSEAFTPFPIDANGVLVFTSPSGIECYLRYYQLLPSHRIVVLGKTTQKALPEGIQSVISPNRSVSSAVEMACQIAANERFSSPF